jgi:hypothetical protein
MFYAVIKDDALLGLFKSYHSARLLQLSNGFPEEFFVVKVEQLSELYNVLQREPIRQRELSLAY